jgi:hypothetical protein
MTDVGSYVAGVLLDLEQASAIQRRLVELTDDLLIFCHEHDYVVQPAWPAASVYDVVVRLQWGLRLAGDTMAAALRASVRRQFGETVATNGRSLTPGFLESILDTYTVDDLCKRIPLCRVAAEAVQRADDFQRVEWIAAQRPEPTARCRQRACEFLFHVTMEAVNEFFRGLRDQGPAGPE